MPSDIRIKRIQDQIHRVLTEILEAKVNDPRVDGVYITDVTVDRELDFATIYVNSLAGKEQAEEIFEGLQAASGFIRFSLSQEVKLRVMPQLRFTWDDTPDRADRIESLLSEIREEREARGDVIENDTDETSEDVDAREN